MAVQKTKSFRIKLLLVILAQIAHLAAFFVFRQQIGSAIFIVSALPAIGGTFLFGFKGGITIAVINVLLNELLNRLTGASMDSTASLLGAATLIFAVAAIGYIRDTHRQLRREAEEKTKEAARDEAILKNIGEGLAVADEDGKIVFMNEVGEKILRFKYGEYMGKSWIEALPLSYETEEFTPFYENPLNPALTAGKKVSITTHYIERRDRTKFPAKITATPIVLNDEIIGAVAIFRDITEEIEIDRLKNDFINLVSHQMRRPISNVRLFLELLLSEEIGALTEQQKELSQRTHQTTIELISLINVFLKISRIGGASSVGGEPTDLVQAAGIILEKLKPQLQSKHIEVALHSPPSKLPAVSLDRLLFDEVLENLLMNAIKYSPDGGTIDLRMTSKEDDILIEVQDNGIGVPLEEQPMIFKKFFRASNAKNLNPEGDGIGLYLVKSLVSIWGGDIWFNSKENEGVTFSFTIPRNPQERKSPSSTL
ncbi:MAG: hypothetical protein A2939_04460 [Parcubacteria group bacterium RIFCSPLOWO2_01_FULL_48_18]|nr:MAG: hypothetical protein A3J67_03660 [Parcubacteria group bacterium RIFCSPHIGHO2_02_FULL_48_10b]OHB22632.1 MAG: hypothetical protein A2939_04460 [Parcubacteria group bacterium RIFCSPLOWO2_01_FULL_48_18]